MSFHHDMQGSCCRQRLHSPTCAFGPSLDFAAGTECTLSVNHTRRGQMPESLSSLHLFFENARNLFSILTSSHYLHRIRRQGGVPHAGEARGAEEAGGQHARRRAPRLGGLVKERCFSLAVRAERLSVSLGPSLSLLPSRATRRRVREKSQGYRQCLGSASRAQLMIREETICGELHQ